MIVDARTSGPKMKEHTNTRTTSRRPHIGHIAFGSWRCALGCAHVPRSTLAFHVVLHTFYASSIIIGTAIGLAIR